jgi:hypothetical protein
MEENNDMGFKSETRIFNVIWQEKRSDLKQWFFYNVVVGLCPFWLSWLPLLFGMVFNKFHKPFLDGNALIFAVTLSGASLGFFAEESRRELKETKRFLFNWLFILTIVSSAGFGLIVSGQEFFPNRLSPWVVGITSLLLFIGGIAFNLHLAAVRLAYTDANLVERILQSEAKALSKQAKNNDSVDGIKL